MLTYTAAIRGARFRGGNAVNILRLMNPGDRFVVVPEFDNAYDENALQAHVNDEQVGFIAKEVAADIAPQLKSDPAARAVAFFLKHESDKKGNPNPLAYVVVLDAGEDEDQARAAFDDELAFQSELADE